MDESPSIDFAIPSRLVSSMDESPLIDCFFWSMDESPLIECTAAGSFEIVVSCPVFEAMLPYRPTSFRVSKRLKRPLAIPMCTVPYQSNTNPYSNFLSRDGMVGFGIWEQYWSGGMGSGVKRHGRKVADDALSGIFFKI